MVRLKFIIKLLIGIILIPTVILGAKYFMEQNGFFSIDNIEIIVENSTDQAKYLQPLVKTLDTELEAYRGTSLWKAELAPLHNRISQLPWVEDVSLARQWPSKLKVNVRAKEIRLVILTKSGRMIPVVHTGEELPAIELRQFPNVALLIGENFESKAELRQKAATMLSEIPKDGAFSQKTISEIHFDDKDGFWMTLINDGVTVKMGQDQIATKSFRVSQVLEYVESRKLNARVIDANLSKKVLVRLRKGP